ncbi:hypothetical protein NHQ30_007102 [Ciborinia camelliae]|nr:hypothetical protein NHQ30_007102 [Ciborinia camelliae]
MEGALKMSEVTYQPSQPSQPPPSTFHSFGRLPTEVRIMIWNAAEELQSGHVIEVCNLPDHYDNSGVPSSFEWYAIPCRCKRKCFGPPLALVNRESRGISLKRRSKCFGQWVNWEKDIIFIGERVGHLHNTGFLHALEKENCRQKLKYLAIDYDCWSNSRCYFCTRRKECTPAAMVSRLPQLQRLVFTRIMDTWRDGNEINTRHPSIFINQYRYPNDKEVCNDLVEFENERFFKWLSQKKYEETDIWDPLPQKIDMWRCNANDSIGIEPYMIGSYKAIKDLDDKHRYSLDGNCGLALVQFDKIKGAYWWEPDDDENEIEFLKDWLQEDFHDLKSVRNTFPGDPDYTTWTPPEINFAILQPTAPSCFTENWEGLEREWIPYTEAYWAKDLPKTYEARDKSKDSSVGQHIEKCAKLYTAEVMGVV